MTQVTWTKEKLKEAFDKYILENGRLPTVPEIDKCEYLPSARQIQRAYGGARKLREILGYQDTHFGAGKFRSEFAALNMERGTKAEKDLEILLLEKFGEPYVHIEKRYGAKSNRLDFFVYTASGNFGVDVFYSVTERDIQKNLNLKIDKYINFPKNVPLYFVLANPDYTQDDIAKITLNMSKLSRIPSLKVTVMATFLEAILSKPALEVPESFLALYELFPKK